MASELDETSIDLDVPLDQTDDDEICLIDIVKSVAPAPEFDPLREPKPEPQSPPEHSPVPKTPDFGLLHSDGPLDTARAFCGNELLLKVPELYLQIKSDPSETPDKVDKVPYAKSDDGSVESVVVEKTVDAEPNNVCLACKLQHAKFKPENRTLNKLEQRLIALTTFDYKSIIMNQPIVLVQRYHETKEPALLKIIEVNFPESPMIKKSGIRVLSPIREKVVEVAKPLQPKPVRKPEFELHPAKIDKLNSENVVPSTSSSTSEPVMQQQSKSTLQPAKKSKLDAAMKEKQKTLLERQRKMEELAEQKRKSTARNQNIQKTNPEPQPVVVVGLELKAPDLTGFKIKKLDPKMEILKAAKRISSYDGPLTKMSESTDFVSPLDRILNETNRFSTSFGQKPPAINKLWHDPYPKEKQASSKPGKSGPSDRLDAANKKLPKAAQKTTAAPVAPKRTSVLGSWSSSDDFQLPSCSDSSKVETWLSCNSETIGAASPGTTSSNLSKKEANKPVNAPSLGSPHDDSPMSTPAQQFEEAAKTLQQRPDSEEPIIIDILDNPAIPKRPTLLDSPSSPILETRPSGRTSRSSRGSHGDVSRDLFDAAAFKRQQSHEKEPVQNLNSFLDDILQKTRQSDILGDTNAKIPHSENGYDSSRKTLLTNPVRISLLPLPQMNQKEELRPNRPVLIPTKPLLAPVSIGCDRPGATTTEQLLQILRAKPNPNDVDATKKVPIPTPTFQEPKKSNGDLTMSDFSFLNNLLTQTFGQNRSIGTPSDPPKKPVNHDKDKKANDREKDEQSEILAEVRRLLQTNDNDQRTDDAQSYILNSNPTFPAGLNDVLKSVGDVNPPEEEEPSPEPKNETDLLSSVRNFISSSSLFTSTKAAPSVQKVSEPPEPIIPSLFEPTYPTKSLLDRRSDELPPIPPSGPVMAHPTLSGYSNSMDTVGYNNYPPTRPLYNNRDNLSAPAALDQERLRQQIEETFAPRDPGVSTLKEDDELYAFLSDALSRLVDPGKRPTQESEEITQLRVVFQTLLTERSSILRTDVRLRRQVERLPPLLDLIDRVEPSPLQTTLVTPIMQFAQELIERSFA